MPAPDQQKQTMRSADGGPGDFAAPVADELAAVRRCMSEQLVTSDDALDGMLGYVGARAGKMLRPAMLLLTGAACANLSDTHVRAAAVVELIHAATLLHDDVLDEAESRRSTRTANRLWGNASAVLLGDFLLSKVFVMSTTLQPPQVGQLLSRATVDICRGELRQNIECRNWYLNEQTYYEIVRDKTAALFAAACYLGSFIAGGPETRHERFREYGLNVGMAFQITDDLLDIVGDEARVGKTLGTDLAHGKVTMPLIHLLASYDKSRRLALIARLSDPLADPRALIDMFRDAGSIEYTWSVARRFGREAADALAAIETPNPTGPLAAIANNIASRSA
jgi:octaprenyl-diphosphate synthase